MTNEQTFHFAKLWRALFRDQSNLDYRMSNLARETRRMFPNGASGNERFHKWTESELGLSRGKSLVLLDRATAIMAVPDDKTWNAVGGFKAVHLLRDIPKSEQVTILEVAKVTDRSIRSVLQERRRATPKPDISPMVVTRKTPERIDVEILAEFIAANVPKMSNSIRKIVDRYVAAKLRAVA